ncbi:MAG: hypothetical protein BWX84_02779 [Verrucomicrobia bacterium ADurb.Bin118]|nr:MAG: hypothetical protein BWX84_02779 [Verrucomicrobia bacterium ADurb.Bin118]
MSGMLMSSRAMSNRSWLSKWSAFFGSLVPATSSPMRRRVAVTKKLQTSSSSTTSTLVPLIPTAPSSGVHSSRRPKESVAWAIVRNTDGVTVAGLAINSKSKASKALARMSTRLSPAKPARALMK